MCPCMPEKNNNRYSAFISNTFLFASGMGEDRTALMLLFLLYKYYLWTLSPFSDYLLFFSSATVLASLFHFENAHSNQIYTIFKRTLLSYKHTRTAHIMLFSREHSGKRRI